MGWPASVAAFLCLAGAPLRAEIVSNDFAPFLIDPAQPQTFVLSGEIDAFSAGIFERALTRYGTPQLIELRSDGGMVGPALEVARRVHALGLPTLVPAEAGCYSACALIFLAGTPRHALGELGVHQITSDSGDLVEGQIALSDILDLLDGFGVPNALIVNMLRTPPDSMYVLSAAEKAAWGLLPVPERPTPEVRAAGNPRAQVLALVQDHLTAWSGPNATALPGVEATYAERLTFYGGELSRAAVMREKAAFAERWPERDYRLRDGTARVECTGLSCSFSGIIDWEARSTARGASSRGAALMELGVSLADGVARIVSEGGRVLERY